jgi:hypothetical protein
LKTAAVSGHYEQISAKRSYQQCQLRQELLWLLQAYLLQFNNMDSKMIVYFKYHCFNCGYTASFILGRNIGFKARRLLEWIGVPENDINQINLESMHTLSDGLN